MDDLHDPVKRFSTEGIAPAARFDYWAEAVSRALLPLKVEAADVSSFEASVSQADLGVLQLIRTQGSAHHSWRTLHDIEQSEARSYHLLVSRGGPWALAQRGQKYLAPGDVVLHDSHYQYRIDIECDYDILNVKLPESWLRTWLADPEILVGRQIMNTSNWGQVLSRMISPLLPEFAAAVPLPASIITDHIGTLLAMLCGEFDSAPLAHRKLEQPILHCMRERCTEPYLTGGDIADFLLLENCTVHAALASVGRSFANELLQMRVGCAVDLLRTPSLRRLKIADVAHRSGFSNVAHFRRVVLKRVGVTPETIRAQSTTGNLNG